ncbi:MAG: Fe-S cluster assembly ATPase SufC [candidate division Zixibacteria bacterium]|nr:Fe-S cluster assembly ATPase SufC [candidate division Zixibacteria bacterium]
MANKNRILSVNDLHVEVEGKEIVKGVSLQINSGEKHAIMGKNGSGKSSLAYALSGHPNYKITSGTVEMGGQDLLEMDATERSLAGLFLGFQYPMTIPGVTVVNFLRAALRARNGNGIDMKNFRKVFKEKMKLLKIDNSFATRYINDGFSGGEKKRLEILQMVMLQPKVAILDETDSGLDIDALKIVANGIVDSAPKDGGVILVTHYQRLLDYIKPDKVHIMLDGRIVKTGGPELALELEAEGYNKLEAKESQKVGV